MELKVLGSVSPYCKLNRNCPGYLITEKDTKILLDCGNGCLSLIDIKDLENMTVIISHLHPDHYGDLPTLAYMSYVANKLGYLNNRIKIYIPNASNYDKIENNLLEYLYLNNIKESFLDIVLYDGIEELKFNNLTVSFKETRHNLTCYAVRIDSKKNKITYSADTGYEIGLFKEFANSSDIFICEATYLKGQNNDTNNHLFAYQAGLYAKEANVDKLLLTHICPELDRNLYLEEAKEIFLNTYLAEEGKVINLGERL